MNNSYVERVTAFFFLTALPVWLHAQYFEKLYDFQNTAFCHDVFIASDGGLVSAGSNLFKTDNIGEIEWVTNPPPLSWMIVSQSFNSALQLDDGSLVVLAENEFLDVRLTKYSSEGDSIWSQTIEDTDINIDIQFGALEKTNDGGFYILGEHFELNPCNCYKGILAKTDSLGNLVDTFTFGAATGPDIPKYYALDVFPDGKIAIGGKKQDLPYLMLFEPDGTPLWETNLFAMDVAQIISVKITENDEIVVAGDFAENGDFPNSIPFVAKYDADGNEIWSSFFDNILGAGAYDMTLTQDEGAIMTGFVGYGGNGVHGFLVKVAENGMEEWHKVYDKNLVQAFFHSVKEDANGDLAIGATVTSSPVFNPKDILLMKTDPFGNLYEHFVVGNIFRDDQLDCTYDGNEPGLQNWIIRAEGDNGDSYYTVANEFGEYEFNLDKGEYKIMPSPRPYWSFCQPSYIIELDSLNDTVDISIPLQPEVDCAFMQVDIATPFIRYCFDGSYAVNYCNYGTIPADNVTVEITLDDHLNYLDATANLLSQNGQVLTFEIGTVQPNECGRFHVYFDMICDTSLIGKTLCTQAHIFPDSLCINDWIGPNIEVEALCEGDSVFFNITNTGGNMPSAFEYIVIEDNIILMSGEFQLGENESISYSTEAQSGATYHIVAAQDPNLPFFLGNLLATASIEGCAGNINIGAFNQVPFDDGEPWRSTDCHEVIASFDPNDKTAFPTGWKEDHIIEANTDLDYLIRFQNTGTDTAFKVVIVDTLSQFLDPSSLQSGAASHPYTFELSRQGVLKFTFDNILLPDSTTNEPASHGFVNFSISQIANNEIGTRIENTAYIYFDFNPPVKTNTVFHTIGEPWVNVLSSWIEVFEPGIQINVFPNPFFEMATIEIEGWQGEQGTFSLIDMNGKVVSQKEFTGNKITLMRHNMPAGVYFFSISSGGRLMGSGKLVLQ